MPVWVAAFGASETVDQARPYQGRPRISFEAGTWARYAWSVSPMSYVRAVQRRDRARVRRAVGPVVVAHDEDRVGAAGRRGRLDRVVGDLGRGVEGELGVRGNGIQLRPNRLDQRRVVIGVTGRDRLEVEVDPIGAAVRDRLRGLRGEVRARRRVSEERRLGGGIGRAPGEERQAQHDPHTVLVGRVDDARQAAAGPARPAGRRGPVAVLLEQVARRGRRRR